MFIRPRPDRETIGLQHVMICEPLELEYLCASVAPMGHETIRVDMILERGEVDQFLLEYRPDVVGITGYITHVEVIRSYCRRAKEILPQCQTIVGGVHAEVVPSDFECSEIDFVAASNGIDTFADIIAMLSDGRPADQVSGVWSREHPPCKKLCTFDHPFPDRGKVSRYRSKYYYLFHNPCALIKTSFGCPFKCEFCFCRAVTDGNYFARSIVSVIEELKGIPETEIYIVDDNFLVSRERVLEFCSRLAEEKIEKKFLIYGRADFIAENEDVMAVFRSHGLRAVIVGLESCQADELVAYNKNNSIAENELAVRVLRRNDIDCYATLILGIDWGVQHFRRLGRWLREMDLTYINLQPFTPLPGTAMLSKYASEISIPREDYAKWDLAHLVLRPTRMSASRYYWNIVWLYHRVTFRPANILKLLYRYGMRQNYKMMLGASRVTLQYLRKVIVCWWRNEA